MSENISLMEARQLYAVLQQIELKIETLKGEQQNVKEMAVNLGQVILLGNRAAFILKRMGLPENVVQAISTIQRLVAVAIQLRISLNLLVMQAGPIGWLLAGLGATATLMSTMDLVGSFG